LAGYIPPDDDDMTQAKQPYSVKLVLRLFVSFVPISLLLISMVPLFFYEIDKTTADENIYILKIKKEASKLTKKTSKLAKETYVSC
jgi:Na+/melibiose symporter-like transporter